MKRVTGIGGIFFKTKDVSKLKEWYKTNLGFATTDWGATFFWRDTDESKKTLSRTEWSPFKEDGDYFAPSELPYMINYRVADLKKLMEMLVAEGVQQVGEIQEFDYGKFGWIMDPEGRKIELWEPVDDQFGDEVKPWSGAVTGLGGVFFKSKNPKEMTTWYQKHLGFGEDTFKWIDLAQPDATVHAQTVWAPFKADSDYFGSANQLFMFNYRVKDLNALLNDLKKSGVTVVGEPGEYPYGKFGWILDIDGNKVELWEPIDDGF